MSIELESTVWDVAADIFQWAEVELFGSGFGLASLLGLVGLAVSAHFHHRRVHRRWLEIAIELQRQQKILNESHNNATVILDAVYKSWDEEIKGKSKKYEFMTEWVMEKDARIMFKVFGISLIILMTSRFLNENFSTILPALFSILLIFAIDHVVIRYRVAKGFFGHNKMEAMDIIKAAWVNKDNSTGPPNFKHLTRLPKDVENEEFAARHRDNPGSIGVVR